jgi:hypothetical protein
MFIKAIFADFITFNFVIIFINFTAAQIAGDGDIAPMRLTAIVTIKCASAAYPVTTNCH